MSPSQSESQSNATTPGSGVPSSPFLPDTPIQFDIITPQDANGSVKSLSGPPKLVPTAYSNFVYSQLQNIWHNVYFVLIYIAINDHLYQRSI